MRDVAERHIVVAEGQRLGIACRQVVFQQLVAVAPSGLPVVGLNDLMHLTVVLRSLHFFRDDEVFAVGRHRPAALGKVVGEHFLGSGDDISLDELVALDAFAGEEIAVLARHPAQVVVRGAHDGTAAEVIDGVEPGSVVGRRCLVRRGDGVASVAADLTAIVVLAVEEVKERQFTASVVGGREQRVGVGVETHLQRVVVTGLGEIFDDNVVGGGDQRQRSVALLAVDIELVVLHLSHFQRALGIAAVGEGELE